MQSLSFVRARLSLGQATFAHQSSLLPAQSTSPHSDEPQAPVPFWFGKGLNPYHLASLCFSHLCEPLTHTHLRWSFRCSPTSHSNVQLLADKMAQQVKALVMQG